MNTTYKTPYEYYIHCIQYAAMQQQGYTKQQQDNIPLNGIIDSSRTVFLIDANGVLLFAT